MVPRANDSLRLDKARAIAARQNHKTGDLANKLSTAEVNKMKDGCFSLHRYIVACSEPILDLPLVHWRC